MNQSGDRVFIFHTDQEFDRAVAAVPAAAKALTRHFSQDEDFFVALADEVEIPDMPIHHDIRQRAPSAELRRALEGIARQLRAQAPYLTEGMAWYFDATEPMALGYFQILRTGDQLYLSLLRVHLGRRLSGAAVLLAGTNDRSPRYRTRRLHVECDIVPLREVRQTERGQYQFHLAQTVSETWVGETGRGYFVTGIWLDRELTKFFSRLFLPEDKRTYPYFPFNCKFRCVCFQPFELDPEGRKRGVALLNGGRAFIEEHIRRIEAELKSNDFSDKSPLFRELRRTIPAKLTNYFQALNVRAYLNAEDSKEFQLDYGTQ